MTAQPEESPADQVQPQPQPVPPQRGAETAGLVEATVEEKLGALRPTRRAFPRGDRLDSLRAACIDAGIEYQRVLKLVKDETFPSLLAYQYRKRYYVRNRPALWAWYTGFGLGAEAVLAWRIFQYESGRTWTATEPEPEGSGGPEPQYATSDQIAAEHLERMTREYGEARDG